MKGIGMRSHRFWVILLVICFVMSIVSGHDSIIEMKNRFKAY